MIPENSGWDVKILATDLDSTMLEKCREGIYPEERIESVPSHVRDKCFKPEKVRGATAYRVDPALKKILTFKRLNLIRTWPMKGPFDFVFCRNVAIYFSKDTQRQLFTRMADLMPVGGHLFIGHSESLHNVTDRFDLVGKTIHVKTK